MAISWIGRFGLWPALLASALAAWSGPASSATAEAGPRPRANALAAQTEDPDNARVIVKYRAGSALDHDAAGAPRHAARLGKQLALALRDGHVLGRRTQSLHASGLSSSQLATRLAARADVEWAVPARRKFINGVRPNDPYFDDNQTTITPAVGQWYLRAPDTTAVSAINALGAWAITQGSASVTVAVLDTGVRFDHPDLGRAAEGGKLWPGYDFVSRTNRSNDGDGRDADATDPGTWSFANECGTGEVAEDSDWHGTQVAGLIGAASDNGIGMASVGRKVMVLPVRVLGKCGGFDDDIQAAMLWAAGLSNSRACNAGSSPALDCNPHPAKVINLSLGSVRSCDPTKPNNYPDVIAQLTAVGVSVVAAAGNADNFSASNQPINEPANCAGVIAVTGLRHAGTKVGYSSLGPEASISAPAGNCVNDTRLGLPCLYSLLTTTNTGTQGPGQNTYSDSFNSSLGTSFSAPLVAGTIGLMLSVDPTLQPAAILQHLKLSARPFPPSSSDPSVDVCTAPGTPFQDSGCHCTTSTCGAGMLDAGAAVARIQSALAVPTAAIGASTLSPTVGDSVALSGAASVASTGRTITGYQWAITSGASLASLVGATDGVGATLATSAAGAVVVQLTVTDNSGASRSTTAALTVAAAPVVVTPTPTPTTSGGGGGGALDGSWLLGLALAVAALAAARPRSARGPQAGR